MHVRAGEPMLMEPIWLRLSRGSLSVSFTARSAGELRKKLAQVRDELAALVSDRHRQPRQLGDADGELQVWSGGTWVSAKWPNPGWVWVPEDAPPEDLNIAWKYAVNAIQELNAC
ncbi:MAG: hypothetical protein H6739_08585 [Alphaproteobacteria bacterium]|nr:hypothetical protein [Alphaproteobacteria bacterium]